MVAKHYGKTYSLQALRTKSFITKSGVAMLGISDAAENIGFRTRGYRLNWEQLRDEVPLPCIVHWNQRHFVVVYDIKKKRRVGSGEWGRKSRAGRASRAGHASQERPARQQDLQDLLDSKHTVYVADPAAGLLKYTKDEFCKCWYSTRSDGAEEGAALLLEPTP
jgi:ATP-binding cassette subfamily B protein